MRFIFLVGIMIFLIDHNIRGQAVILLGTLAAEGWLDILPVRFANFEEFGLSSDSDDLAVWRCAQANQLILITANRSMKGRNSLEQTMREENTPMSFPVITISSVDRLDEAKYRERCVTRIVEVALDIDNYMGTGRIFVP
ncbi:MAG: hypothetical protein Fur0025_07470 [Oscillatoriaceae cyanobacterium]